MGSFNTCRIMKFYFSALCISLISSDVESLSTRTLTFKDDRCHSLFNPTSRESFEVIHTTEELSYICNDMSFSGWDDVETLRREVCVKVEEFTLDCSQRLEYRADSSRGTPDRWYDCSDTAENIPVFCTFEILYIRIKTEEKIPSTKVVYTVYAGREDTSNEEDFPVSAVIGPIVLIGVGVFVSAIVICLVRRRNLNARQNQLQGGVVTYRQTQQPNVNIHHYYHQGDQGMTSNQGQIQGQPLLPQGYNVPPTAPPQFQVYPQYPSGQQMIPSQPSPHVQQPIKDMSVPPSYDEVTKG